MAKKPDITTVEGAQKALEIAINRHAEARVGRVTVPYSSVITSAERQLLIQAVRDSHAAVLKAITDFETAVRTSEPLSQAMTERCTPVEINTGTFPSFGSSSLGPYHKPED